MQSDGNKKMIIMYSHRPNLRKPEHIHLFVIVFVERKTLGMNWKKNRGLTKHLRVMEGKTEEARPCTKTHA